MRNKLSAVTMLLILTVVLTSCQTSPPEVVTVVEYRDRPMPEINWPVLPDPAGRVKSQGDTVTMPLAYWLDLTRYIIDVEAGIELYEAGRAE